MNCKTRRTLLFMILAIVIVMLSAFLFTMIEQSTDNVAYADYAINKDISGGVIDAVSQTGIEDSNWSWSVAKVNPSSTGGVVYNGLDHNTNTGYYSYKWTISGGGTSLVLKYTYTSNTLGVDQVVANMRCTRGASTDEVRLYGYYIDGNSNTKTLTGGVGAPIDYGVNFTVKTLTRPTDVYSSITRDIYFKLSYTGETSAVIYINYLKVQHGYTAHDVAINSNNADTAGTDTIYYINDDGYYLDSAFTQKMTTTDNPIPVLPERTGYILTGFVAYEGSSVSEKNSFDKDGYVVNYPANAYYLMAIWQAKKYNIYFHQNYGTSPETLIDTREIYYDEYYVDLDTYSEYTTPEREGWVFDGYYTADGTIVYYKSGASVIESAYTTDADLDLYAHWKMKPTVSVTNVYSGIYDGQAHVPGTITVTDPTTLIGEGQKNEYTIYYKNGNNWEETMPQLTNAGTHKVYYAIVFKKDLYTYGNDQSDYATITEYFEVTIEKADITSGVVAPTAITSLKYTAYPQVLIQAGSTEKGTIKYKVDNGSYTANLEEVVATTAGTHTIYYKVFGGDNYNDTEEQSFTVTIAENDKTELIAAIAEANDYRDKVYAVYPDIVGDFDAAITAAQGVADTASVTTQQLEDAIAALATATSALEVDFVEAAIDAIGTVELTTQSRAKIDNADNEYDKLSPTQQGQVSNYDKVQKAQAKWFDLLVDDIGTVELTDTCKEKLDAACDYYLTLADPDETQYVTKKDALDAALLAYQQLRADPVIGKINAIGTVEYTPECKAKIDDAREAYEGLTNTQKGLVTNYDTLTAAEEAYNQAAANYTKDKISAIGTVEYTPECKAKIEAAREAYDALDATQKALVTNADDLTEAEEAYLQAAINYVKGKIDAIGTVEKTPECKAKIEAAREAYDALTAEEKTALGTEYANKLIDAEQEYLRLVKQVEEKINAIGTVEYTPECKAKIDEARAAYDALTDADKEFIDETVYAKLVKAEKDYDQMDIDATRSRMEDKDSNVVIETKGSGVPRDVELRVEVKTEVSSKEGKIDVEAVQKTLKRSQKIAKIYDVTLIQTINGVEKEIQPSEIKEGMTIKIRMGIPEGIDTTGLSVLHIHDNGSIDVIENVTIVGNEAIVEVDSLSQFALVEKSEHGFCVGWILFIFGILEMLCLALYIILRFGLCKEFVAKCKLDSLYAKMKELTFGMMGASDVLFLFSLIALCLHQCALTIVFFILILLMNCVLRYFFMKDLDIIAQIKNKD